PPLPLVTIRRPPRTTLSPYTTLFRSVITTSWPIRIDSPSFRVSISIRPRPDRRWHARGTLSRREPPGARRESDGSRRRAPRGSRSEEHTSELQSRENLVCRLLLEKKK